MPVWRGGRIVGVTGGGGGGGIDDTFYTKTLTGGAATSFLDVSVPANSGVSGTVIYEIEAVNDAVPKERNIVRGECAFTSLNKNGVAMVSDTTNREDSESDTNATALSISFDYVNTVASSKVTLRCTASSTLAGVVTYTMKYAIEASKVISPTPL